MLTHEAVLRECVSCIVEGEIAATDRVLHALPLYHCAQRVVFVDSLPKNPSGKLLKRELRARFGR